MLHLASTHHGLRRTFLGELVLIFLNVPYARAGGGDGAFEESRGAERLRFSVASREHGPRPTSPHAPGFLVKAHAKSNAATIQRACANCDVRSCVRTTCSL